MFLTEKAFKMSYSKWNNWLPTLSVIETKRRQLTNSANLLKFFEYCDQLASQNAKNLKFQIEPNVIVQADCPIGEIKPEIEKSITEE